MTMSLTSPKPHLDILMTETLKQVAKVGANHPLFSHYMKLGHLVATARKHWDEIFDLREDFLKEITTPGTLTITPLRRCTPEEMLMKILEQTAEATTNYITACREMEAQAAECGRRETAAEKAAGKDQ